MPSPNFVLLYVDSPEASGTFYAGLLERQPVETSPTFVMFALENGVMLGLWSRRAVQPAASAAGGAELAFTVEPAALEATFADWKKRGIAILQQPTDMDFGRTFVGLDPDGHRLRVFSPSGQ